VITSWTLLIGKGTLLPAEWHSPIRQTAAVLLSPEAQKILNDGGLWSFKAP